MGWAVVGLIGSVTLTSSGFVLQVRTDLRRGRPANRPEERAVAGLIGA